MQLLLEQTSRMLAEVHGLNTLAAEAPWLTNLAWGFADSKDICADFNVTIGTKTWEAELLYPSLFPEIPAYVRPKNSDESWSVHQYRGKGTLCLEWGPDNWHPDITGADLVYSTYKLLAHEILAPIIGLEAPSRHELTPGQRLRGETFRFLVTPELLKAFNSLVDQACIPITIATSIRFNALVAYTTKLGSEKVESFPGIPREMTDPKSLFNWLRNGFVVRCSNFDGLPNGINSQPTLREWLEQKQSWPWSPEEQNRSGFFLLVDNANRIRPIALSTGDENTALEYAVVDCHSSAERQPPQHKELASKRVAIVGLGSVGSKIAVSLARSGVRRFLLVDDDILLPHNLVRNQLDWLSVGYGKVDGVKGAIKLVAPDATVDARSFNFAGQESASYNTTVLEQVAACDLVVDATASTQVFSSLAAICTRRAVALVWGEVFSGGVGGLMARSQPGKDAGPLDVRATINGYLGTLPEAPFMRAHGYDVEADDEVLIAGDAEVSLLAAAMTQFTIDALLPGTKSRFPVAAYLFGYSQAWAFNAPFDTHPIVCPAADSAGTNSAIAETNPVVLAELLEAFTERKC